MIKGIFTVITLALLLGCAADIDPLLAEAHSQRLAAVARYEAAREKGDTRGMRHENKMIYYCDGYLDGVQDALAKETDL